MAQEGRRFSPRDEAYLNSTGFEPYMAAGIVFLVILTAVFIFSIKIHFAWLFWPGMFVAVLGGYATLNRLERREYRRKLAELEAEAAQREAVEA